RRRIRLRVHLRHGRRRRELQIALMLSREDDAKTAARKALVAGARDEEGEPLVQWPLLARREGGAENLHRLARADLGIGERLLRIGEVRLVDLVEAHPAAAAGLRPRVGAEVALVPGYGDEDRGGPRVACLFLDEGLF